MAVLVQGNVAKKRWSTQTREKITAVSKGFSEIMAGIAEPAMRYATIYMALATALAFLKWGPLFNFSMGVVIAMPEFILIGAFAIAETAIAEGRKKWGILLFITCLVLTAIVIATLVDIFIYTFPDSYVKMLNFSRCLVALAFSVIIGKLEDDQEKMDTKQADQVSILQQELSTLRVHVDTSNKKVDSLNGQVDTLRGQVEAKEKEVSMLRIQVESGHLEASNLRDHLDNKQSQLTGEQGIMDTLKQRLMQAELDASALRGQVNGKQVEVSSLQNQVDTLQQKVSTLTVQLDTSNRKMDTLRGQLESKKVSTVDTKMDSGHPNMDTQMDGRVIQLESKKQEKDLDDQIKAMLQNDPSLSDRAIANALKCSPTTVGKRRKTFDEKAG